MFNDAFPADFVETAQLQSCYLGALRGRIISPKFLAALSRRPDSASLANGLPTPSARHIFALASDTPRSLRAGAFRETPATTWS
jgi:hypothetical protein